MRLTRVHCREPLAPGLEIALDAVASEHVARVLRLRAGAALTVFDGSGGEFDAEILAIGRGGVRLAVGRHRPGERESALAITLVQGISRGERMDLVVQKATELGVTRIVPLEAERSVVQLEPRTRERKVAHWQAVAASACEQCGRNRLPEISEPRALDAALAELAPTPARLLLDPGATRGFATMLAGRPPAVVILIGPEGGLTDAEIAHALRGGFTACTLGPRILRTETAAIAALAIIQALAGDLGVEAPPNTP